MSSGSTYIRTNIDTAAPGTANSITLAGFRSRLASVIIEIVNSRFDGSDISRMSLTETGYCVFAPEHLYTWLVLA
jgi:hypothetical protein